MPSSKPPRKLDVTRWSDPNLLETWGRIMVELRRREIVRSGNSPIGDLAERIVEDQYGGKRAPANTTAYDVKVGKRKLQVKAIRMTKNRGMSLSPIRSQKYNAVVVVVFDELLHVREMWELPRRAVKECGRYSEHVNGHILSLAKVRKHRDAKSIQVKRAWRQ